MKIRNLIKRLKTMPPYADVLIDDGEAFRGFSVKKGDNYPKQKRALVKLKLGD